MPGNRFWFIRLGVAVVILLAGWIHSGAAQDGARNPMREMMRRMMTGFVPPLGMTPENLPDPESTGARLVGRYCAQCHDLPSPRYKTAEQWPAVYERMLQRMRMMGGGMMGGGMMMGTRIDAPGDSESRVLLAYLRAQGMREARPEELAAGPSKERAVFREVCSRCHALPSPSLHSAEDWAGVIARMEGNMRLMNRPAVEPHQREAILRFLQTASQ
jgi:cytochrome c5